MNKTDSQKLKEYVAKFGHTTVYETRTVSDAMNTGSGDSIRQRRGWWMGSKFLGENAADALMYLGADE